jgi:hypothetical protein
MEEVPIPGGKALAVIAPVVYRNVPFPAREIWLTELKYAAAFRDRVANLDKSWT